MPNWKKIVTSGSDAALNSLNVTSGVTGSLFGTASFATTASFALNVGATINTGSFATTGSNIFIGNQTISGSLSQGLSTLASGSFSHAEGFLTIASGSYSHAEGSGSISFGIGSHAEGEFTMASGSYSHAEGYYTSASEAYSHAEGYGSIALGVASHAEGIGTAALGNVSHTEGNETTASGDYSHTEGSNTTTLGYSSHAEGYFTLALGSYSHAEGYNTVTSGSTSHAEGNSTQAIGIASHAEGWVTQAVGSGSHAEGYFTSASGPHSHAEGSGSIASGLASHAEGLNTVAQGNYQHVQGQYNISSSVQSAFIVGNGTDDSNRRNLIYAAGTQVEITGSLNVTQGITGSLFGTASFATTASFALNAGTTINTSSLATTGSNSFVGNQTITGSFTVTTGSNIELQVLDTGVRLGNISTDAHTITGSLGVSGSLNITGSDANTLQVRGSGSAIASSAIQARNGAGTTLFTVRNDGKTVVGSNSGSTASGVLTIFQGGSSFGNGINFQTTANDANTFGIGASSTSTIQMGFNAGYWNVTGNRLGSSLVSLDTNGYGTLGTGLYGSGIDIQGTYTNPGGAGFGNGGGRGGNSFVDSAIVTVNASSTNTLAQYATLFANRTVNITGSQLPISSIVLNNTYNQTQAVSSGSIIGINHMPVLTSAYNYRAFDFGNTTVYTPNAAVTNYVWSTIYSNVSASVNNQQITGLDIVLSGSNSSFTGVRRSALRLATQNTNDTALTAVGTVIITGSLIVTGGITGSLSGSSGGGAAFPFTGSAGISGSLSVNGPISGSYVRLSGSFNTAASGSILTVIGSGSAQPIFTVQGSQGELFSVTDSLTGSLFSVNDISGLPILEVFSDNTILMGDYQDPMLLTTKKVTQTNSGSFIIYSIPTASYDGAFIEYTIKSGSNARAGTIMSTWAGSSIEFTEVDTMDIGNTAVVGLTMILSGSNAVMTGSSSTGSWTIRTIIRAV